MFARSFVALALGALALGRSIPLAKRTGKDHWWSMLEPYDQYHTRYMALSCETQHGQPFFDLCCHPRLKNVDLSTIPEQCIPADDECDDDDDDQGSDPGPATPAQTPTHTPAPAPTPKPKPTQAPTPTTTHHTTTTSAHSPVKTSGSGHGTWFTQNGNAGACGNYNKDSSFVVALDSRIYTQSLCGKTIHLTNTDNGHTVTAIVADECPTCASSHSVDLSVAAFKALAAQSVGDIPISWTIDQ